jgi:hypothetical protein
MRGLRIVRAIVSTRERQLFVIALLVRLLPAAMIFGTEDVYGWEAMGKALAEGRNPYPTNYVSWPPFWLPWTAASWMTSSALDLPFHFVVKLLPIAADIIITFVLYFGAKAYGRKPFATALAYALNPIAVYTSAIHGQFDSIPALCTTVAVLVTGSERPESEWRSAGTWLGVGAAFKTWPLFALPAVLAPLRRLRHKAGLAAIAIGIFVGALLLPWPFVGRKAVMDVLRYRSASGWWGLASLQVLNGSAALSADPLMWLFYLAMAAAAFVVLLAKPRAIDGALLMLLTFLVFTPGFGIQYLLWVVPVALLADQRRAIFYSILGGVLIAVEALARPYVGHVGDTIRLLPHVGFARAYGSGLDQIYVIGGRLVLWAFVCYWWILRMGRSLNGAFRRLIRAAATGDDVRSG